MFERVTLCKGCFHAVWPGRVAVTMKEKEVQHCASCGVQNEDSIYFRAEVQLGVYLFGPDRLTAKDLLERRQLQDDPVLVLQPGPRRACGHFAHHLHPLCDECPVASLADELVALWQLWRLERVVPLELELMKLRVPVFEVMQVEGPTEAYFEVPAQAAARLRWSGPAVGRPRGALPQN